MGSLLKAVRAILKNKTVIYQHDFLSHKGNIVHISVLSSSPMVIICVHWFPKKCYMQIWKLLSYF